jgi:hypothetical protein
MSEQNPFPHGFTARIAPATSTERALMNKLFYNPGGPFEGEVFVAPDPLPQRLVQRACARLVYDPNTPPGQVEASSLQRLTFDLVLGNETRFVVCEPPLPVEQCWFHVSRFNHNEPIPLDPNAWKSVLTGLIIIQGNTFAVNNGFNYKLYPQSVYPRGAGIITKDTQIIIDTENNIYY